MLYKLHNFKAHIRTAVQYWSRKVKSYNLEIVMALYMRKSVLAICRASRIDGFDEFGEKGFQGQRSGQIMVRPREILWSRRPFRRSDVKAHLFNYTWHGENNITYLCRTVHSWHVGN